jgi:ABC-type polysaccharide/polyol phosphate transport system ATPase subunit
MSRDFVISCQNITVEYSYSNYDYSTFKEFVFQKLRGERQVQRIKALDNVSLEVGRGEAVALIGHNGSGKSTFLKVLAGIITPSEGAQLKIQGRIAPMIELGTGFDGELSGLENIYLSCAIMGLTRSEIDSRLEDIINFSELRNFLHMPVKNYSSGMQARLGFACTTAVDPDILLVDEVLAVGDANFARKCLDRIEALRSKGTTIVLVSHDPNVVRTFCDKGYVFEGGKLRFQGDIFDALHAHDEIMEERRIQALSPEERKEYERKQLLETDAKSRKDGQGSLIPKIYASHRIVQNGEEVGKVDLSQAFELIFELAIRHAEYFDHDVSCGIGLMTNHGVRIGGANNIEKSRPISRELLLSAPRVLIKFQFSEGLQVLLAGAYKLIFGIHDRNLTRTILYQEMGLLECINSRESLNSDQDLLKLSAFLSNVEAMSV